MSDEAEDAVHNPCPKCKTALEEIEEREVPFLGCTTCFGLFVTARDLHDYVVRAAGALPVGEAFTVLLDNAMAGKTTPAARRCPRCEQPLNRMGFGEAPFVILDLCPDDGLWLDKKELTKVLRASRAQAATMGLIEAFHDEDEGEDEAEAAY